MQFEIGDEVFEVVPPKFKIGDEVVSKKFGYPAKGKILSIIYGKSYRLSHGGSSFEIWDEQFPEWDGGFVYEVIFKDKMHPMTIDEMCSNFNIGKELAIDICIRIPQVNVLGYVEADLEAF